MLHRIAISFMALALLLTACSTTSDPAIFLAENSVREGVSITESGLQYEVLKPSNDSKPDAQSKVTVHYIGTLTDGSEFDNSIKRGQSATFPVAGVIPGLSEGLQLMSIGSRYRFVVPAALAYGDRGAGKAIAPGATLIFEVELLNIDS